MDAWANRFQNPAHVVEGAFRVGLRKEPALVFSKILHFKKRPQMLLEVVPVAARQVGHLLQQHQGLVVRFRRGAPAQLKGTQCVKGVDACMDGRRYGRIPVGIRGGCSRRRGEAPGLGPEEARLLGPRRARLYRKASNGDPPRRTPSRRMDSTRGWFQRLRSMVGVR